MKHWILVLCVIPTIVGTITITPNGNSPDTKVIGGIAKDAQNSMEPMASETTEYIQKKNQKDKVDQSLAKLSINERYRRLIPYMTFYYANDLLPTTTEGYIAKSVEVEKAQIIETRPISPFVREPKVIFSQRHKNIPLYQGNRLTQHNIASSNPSKLYYKSPTFYQNFPKATPNYNPIVINTFENSDRTYERLIPKYNKPSNTQYIGTRKPYLNLQQNDNFGNVQYYSSEKEQIPLYKLVPYEQTPPVSFVPQVENIVVPKKTFALSEVANEPVYTPPRPDDIQYVNGNSYKYRENLYREKLRKPPTIVSEMYYEKQHPITEQIQPAILENGFKPIISPLSHSEVPHYEHEIEEESTLNLSSGKHQNLPEVNTQPVTYKETYKPIYATEKPFYKPPLYATSNKATLSDLIQSLQINKSIPKPITRQNLGSSINTLLQVLNVLKAMPQKFEAKTPVLSTLHLATTASPISSTPETDDAEFQEEPYLAPVRTPSQYLDDIPTDGSSSQRFPLPITSDNEGGTPGRPGIDYPILTIIPPTSFDCKTQRYKGFFADTETKCQVWHYCDLNGGQASFLCPNGTIFSQAGLTCDWWFNVRCASTTQLYVLNESLYKFILPHSPKFPEDYSGPLVDKYLTLKFKEMEEQFRKNKNKQSTDDTNNSTEGSDEKTDESAKEKEDSNSPKESVINEADVVIESDGRSGNVQRLQDD